jgi:hypothetical protein
LTTTYFLNLIAGNVFKSKTNPAIPTAYYLGVSTTAPALDGTGFTEPSGGGYARVNITSALGAPVNGLITNSAVVSFAESTVAWSTTAAPTAYYGIFDASTSGNLLCYGELDPTRVIDAATALAFKVGEIKLQVKNP